MGTGMLLFTLFGVIDSFVDLKVVDKGFFIGILYISWAIGQFFDKKNYFNYPKAFSAYMTGILTFSFGVILLGAVIDFIK